MMKARFAFSSALKIFGTGETEMKKIILCGVMALGLMAVAGHFARVQACEGHKKPTTTEPSPSPSPTTDDEA
jgi:hypothetical protein